MSATPAGATLKRPGRPRSEPARRAVLHAVDDMLVEVGYAAMTMKGIAERAGVGRQTVYRWWSGKAEILLEACTEDIQEEVVTPPDRDPAARLLAYLQALTAFLVTSPAGLAYRALIGEAQHDPAVRDLVNQADLLTASARDVLESVRPAAPGLPALSLATAQLTGPVISQILTAPEPLSPGLLREHVAALLRAWQ